MSVAPGWYDDPSQAGQLRYWDGQQWTPHTHRPQAAAPQQTAPQQTVPQQTAPVQQQEPQAQGYFTPPATQTVSQGTYGAQGSYAPASAVSAAPMYTGAPIKKRVSGRAIGLIVGGVGVVAAAGVGVFMFLNSLDGDASSDDAAAATTAASPEPSADAPTVTAAASLDDYVVPTGLVQVTHPVEGVAYGVLDYWADITEAYVPVLGVGPQEMGGETVTFLDAWALSGLDSMSADQVLVMYSELPFEITTQKYMPAAQRDFEAGATSTTWTDAVTFTNDVGMSVTHAQGTQPDSQLFATTDMYLIGGGRNLVLLQCTAYVASDACDSAAAVVASIYVAP